MIDYESLNYFFNKTLKKNPKLLAFLLKKRIKDIESLSQNCIGSLLKESLEWCKKKQYEVNKVL